MKRVLYIAYAFPPCGGAGVQRSAKFVRYLPAHGWQPTVLTVDPSCYGVTDTTHADDFPKEVRVLRTPHMDPLATIDRNWPRVAANGNSGGLVRQVIRSGKRKLAVGAWMGLSRILIPDATLLWKSKAVEAAMSEFAKRPFDVVCATGEPYSAYLIGQAIAERTHRPFVIDMRDPWTVASYRNRPKMLVRDRIEKRQERDILDNCDAAVFAFRFSGLYDSLFPDRVDRWHYVPNGYDPEDLVNVTPRTFDRFTIVHNGTFLPGYRTADTILMALRRMLDETPELKDHIQLILVGKRGLESQQIDDLNLKNVVRQTGYLPHHDSLSYVKGADLLLLIGGTNQWEETGKIYEYLAANRRILGLVRPDGSAAELLQQCPHARVADREDVGATTQAISAAMKQSDPQDNDRLDWLTAYERSNLTGRLAEVFNSVVDRNRDRPAQDQMTVQHSR